MGGTQTLPTGGGGRPQIPGQKHIPPAGRSGINSTGTVTPPLLPPTMSQGPVNPGQVGAGRTTGGGQGGSPYPGQSHVQLPSVLTPPTMGQGAMGAPKGGIDNGPLNPPTMGQGPVGGGGGGEQPTGGTTPTGLPGGFPTGGGGSPTGGSGGSTTGGGGTSKILYNTGSGFNVPDPSNGDEGDEGDGINNPDRVEAMDRGGVITKPTKVRVGEAGPEAVVKMDYRRKGER